MYLSCIKQVKIVYPKQKDVTQKYFKKTLSMLILPGYTGIPYIFNQHPCSVRVHVLSWADTLQS